ncbi:MAG: hypothetical protein ACK2UE_06540 [Anaerolineales bacterium]
MAIIVLVPLIYLIIALNTGDLLWASPVFNASPQTITIHCFGEDVYLDAGTADFEAVTDLVNESLSGRKRWDSITISNETYQDYQSHPQMMVVELTYPKPIRVHSRYKFFSNVDRIIIPLVGRHSETNAIFGRRLEYTTAGSFHVNDLTGIKDFLADSELCIEP